jgi:hypothetical protein
VEIQGYVDDNFAYRMFVYYYRILDLFGKPVASIAVLTDDNEEFCPDKFENKFLRTKVYFGFNSWKLAAQTQQTFQNKRNIFSIVMETAWLGLPKNRKDDETLFNHARQLIRKLLEGGFPKTKIRKVLQYY